MKPFKRILVATDLTPASRSAVSEAVALAKENGAELMIAHVCETPSISQEAAIAPGVYDEWTRNLKETAQERLQPLLEESRKEGVHAGVLVLFGAPYEAIVEAAQSNNADLIIVGTHGRKGVSRLFLGSVASRVISTAHCPVMTVRAA
jgi:nucleotide-binding universal stress UspA family protein